MKCDLCDGKMVERVATSGTPYHYLMSGLEDVYLSGITVRTCSKCEAESPIIPRLPELHNVIADVLLKKPSLLRGDEIRFLRKHVEFPASHFAALLHIDPSHLSKVENGHIEHLGNQADQLVRAYVIASGGAESYPRNVLMLLAEQRLAATHNAKTTPEKAKSRPPLFRLVSNRWKVAA